MELITGATGYIGGRLMRRRPAALEFGSVPLARPPRHATSPGSHASGGRDREWGPGMDEAARTAVRRYDWANVASQLLRVYETVQPAGAP